MPIAAFIAAIRAWGIWPVVTESIGKALRWLWANPWRISTMAALLLNFAQAVRIDGLYLRPHIGPVGITLIDRPGWRPRALVAEASMVRMIAASAQAAALAEANRIATEAASAAHARKADREIPPIVMAQRAAADHYADGRRLHPAPAGHPTGPTATPDPADPAPDYNGPGADAVVIPRAHFDQLRDNTLRLERIRLWGEREIEAGRAAKVEQFNVP